MYSPLAQFDIVSIVPIYIIGLDLTITNMTITIGVCLFIFITIFNIVKSDIRLVPKSWQFLFESVFLFIYRLVYDQIGLQGLVYFPFLITLFSFMLVLNLMGLVPYSFAATSQFIWTLYFSLSICLGIFFIGLRNHKIKFLKIFLPDVPLMLYPLMIAIELASYVIRSFSLAIRLSANIMAGHILVHILADAVYKLGALSMDLVFITLCLLLGLFVLEFGVACLQAYVFTLLICIYLNDAVNLPVH